MSQHFTPSELDDLQRLRTLVAAFRQMIANMDARDQYDAYNEQFNKMRFEIRSILASPGFDQAVPKAVTIANIAERAQRTNARLSGIVIVGVILALLGLGLNSIILEDMIVNSLGCLISVGGMLLVIGALAVLGVVTTRRALTNLGDLYLHCESLLGQLDQTLNAQLPGYQNRPAPEMAQIPGTAALLVDSIEKQMADWRDKLESLKRQREIFGASVPFEVNSGINFVQRELQRLEFELADLRARVPQAFIPHSAPEAAETTDIPA